MKKTLILLIVVFSILTQVVFAESQTLNFIMTVEEDYGVNIPDDVIRLDRFVFEYIDAAGTPQLLSESTFDVGELIVGDNTTIITLRYYGNLSKDYEVRVSGDIGAGWDVGNKYIPVNISFVGSEDKPDDVTVTETRYGEAEILIPASGMRTSVPIVDLILNWDGDAELFPGEYIANLVLELSVV